MIPSCAKILAAAVLLIFARHTPAAVTLVEDLAGCKLPNGIATLPAAGSTEAARGALLKIATKTMTAAPVSDDGKPLPPDQAVARIRNSKTADVQYLPEFKGLWAFSGCIDELPGAAYLSDASARKLDAPGEILAMPHTPAGVYDNIHEGRIYLLETTDKRYALLRVLEAGKNSVVVQYVYQPDGSVSFEVPANSMIPYRGAAGEQPPGDAATRQGASSLAGAASPGPSPAAPAAAATRSALALAGSDTSRAAPGRGLSTPPGLPRQELGPDDYVAPGYIITGRSGQPTAAGMESTINAFLQQRTQLIQRRMEIVRAPANTNAEIDAKSRAILDLADLHAGEAADLLVDQIAFLNARTTAREFSADALHPAVAALKRLGKPATQAALRGLEKLDLGAGEGIESDRYKADLLAMVIVAVESRDVAAFMLRRELEGQNDAHRRAVLEYVLGKIAPQQQ